MCRVFVDVCVMQCVAVCCSVLQCFAVWQCFIVYIMRSLDVSFVCWCVCFGVL